MWRIIPATSTNKQGRLRNQVAFFIGRDGVDANARCGFTKFAWSEFEQDQRKLILAPKG